MGNPTSRHLQTLKPLSTFEFCPSVTAHDESVTAHELLGPLTLQIIMATMVPHGAVDNAYQYVEKPKGPDSFTINVESALNFSG